MIIKVGTNAYFPYFSIFQLFIEVSYVLEVNGYLWLKAFRLYLKYHPDEHDNREAQA